jgi:hypothetical protein
MGSESPEQDMSKESGSASFEASEIKTDVMPGAAFAPPAEESVSEYVGQAADFDSELASIWDESGSPMEDVRTSSLSGAPKKRRRRRPRKSSSAPKSEGGQDMSQEPVSSAPPNTAIASRRQEEPSSRGAASQSSPRPGRDKATETQNPPAKPKKKIFLE